MFKYLKSRGLDEETINKFSLKEEDKIIKIPYYGESGKILFYKCRSKYSKNFWYYPKDINLSIYNSWNLKSYKDYVVITEGEIDCLTLLQFGINAVGSPGAALFKKDWIKLFDYIDKVYIAFDNDIAGIEGAKKLTEEYFSNRDTYNILIPRDKGTKDINDLTMKLGYKKDDFLKNRREEIKNEAKPTNNRKKKSKDNNIVKVSRFVTEKKIGEIVFSKEERTGSFAIYDRETEKVEYTDSYEHKGITYLTDINSDLILNGIVKIPNKVIEYGTTKDLVLDLEKYIDKYVDITGKYNRDVVITYILLTWVYERFSSIPYMRALGDYGSGKSRLLRVLNVCYKSIYASGNTSEAPIFRLMHKFGGTLIIDEVELSRKSDKNEGIKDILRFGTNKDGVVTRCDGQNFEVKAYKVFGPKILGARRSYGDNALESRIIDIRMKETQSNSIPLNLDIRQFEADSEVIRSKLLYWSFRNFFKINTNVYKKYIDNSISKRINETNSPLICIRDWDADFINQLIAKARHKHMSLMEEKSLSLEANIVRAIVNIYEVNLNNPLLKNIAIKLSEQERKNYSSRFIAKFVRDCLGFNTGHTRDGDIVVVERKKLDGLIKEYNIDKY